MTWAITCSLASSHGIRLPLHQIDSLALMAIEALLVFVAEWSVCQKLPGHFRNARSAGDPRWGIAIEHGGHCGLSLTGNYNRGGTAEVEQYGALSPQIGLEGKNILQLVPARSHFTPRLLQLAAANPIRGQ